MPPVRAASAAITRYILRKVRATGAVEPMGPWAMGHLDLQNIVSSEKNSKTDQMWFFYDLPPKVTYIPTPLTNDSSG